MKTADKTFSKVYSAVAVIKNYLEPEVWYNTDNGFTDLYEDDNKFAGMTDNGYYRYVGVKGSDGKVVWRVSESYGPKGYVYSYSGITKEEFESLNR